MQEGGYIGNLQGLFLREGGYRDHIGFFALGLLGCIEGGFASDHGSYGSLDTPSVRSVRTPIDASGP